MKKIILAAAVVLTTGVLALITRETDVKADKIAKISFAFEKQVTGTAD